MADQHQIFITSCAAGDAGAITSCNLDTGTGALEELNRFADIENPFFIALSPDHKVLYATHVPGDFEADQGYVASFEIGAEGRLSKINEQPAHGTTTCYVDVDPSGRAVMVANYSSGSVASYPVQRDGALGAMASFVEHAGAPSAVDAERQEAAHAHCAAVSPDGRHVYACDLGLDQVLGYALDTQTAQLTALDQVYVRTIGGGGPRHFTYHPQGGYVYANNELANSVNVFSYDANTGVLIERQVISSLPEDYYGESATADVKATPDGRFLYCTNRGHDSIAIYSIGGDGCLSLVDIQESGGNCAQNLAITPDGGTMLCANMVDEEGKGANVVVFTIDGETGKLSAVGEPVVMDNPSCIMVV